RRSRQAWLASSADWRAPAFLHVCAPRVPIGRAAASLSYQAAQQRPGGVCVVCLLGPAFVVVKR
ncbi:unnamed protein product, partial [Amoebophrya sp. A120]